MLENSDCHTNEQMDLALEIKFLLKGIEAREVQHLSQQGIDIL